MLVVPTLGRNSLVRAVALGMVLDSIGRSWRVVAFDRSKVWPALLGTQFQRKCFSYEIRDAKRVLRQADKVIALKPLGPSFGLCLRNMEKRLGNLVVDIDDPDLELRLGWDSPVEAITRRLLRPRKVSELLSLRRNLKDFPKIFSNPALRGTQNGLVIPHVRELASVSRNHVEPGLVGFLGTARRHKGLQTLREAVEINQGTRLRQLKLVVSDKPPSNARPWETWTGRLTFDQMRKLDEKIAISAVLMEHEPYRSMQLPAKAIDAIAAGIPVIRSSTKPLDWLFGNSGIVVDEARATSVLEGLIFASKLPSGFMKYPKDVIDRILPSTYAQPLSSYLNQE